MNKLGDKNVSDKKKINIKLVTPKMDEDMTKIWNQMAKKINIKKRKCKEY